MLRFSRQNCVENSAKLDPRAAKRAMFDVKPLYEAIESTEGSDHWVPIIPDWPSDNPPSPAPGGCDLTLSVLFTFPAIDLS